MTLNDIIDAWSFENGFKNDDVELTLATIHSTSIIDLKQRLENEVTKHIALLHDVDDCECCENHKDRICELLGDKR